MNKFRQTNVKFAGEQVPSRPFHNEDWNPPEPPAAALVHQFLHELILPKMLPGAITYHIPGASSSSPSYFNCNCQVFLEEERKSFIDDYRLTACMNVLKWFVTNLSEQVIIIIIIVDSVI